MMSNFEIVAHRGKSGDAPENTIQAFEDAIALGVDAVELDVRLTRDGIPIVYHYFYLDVLTDLTGPVFDYAFDELSEARFKRQLGCEASQYKIPALSEVLALITGRIGMEIEIKGPEPEAPKIIGELLQKYRRDWNTIEVTSFEPQLLIAIQDECLGLTVDLLYPRSEPWMNLDVVAYTALHKARLAKARAVHLHPTQLSGDVVSLIEESGLEIHAWDVNDELALKKALEHEISRVCTDDAEMAMSFRNRLTGRPGPVN